MESEFMRMQREATEQLRRMSERSKAAPLRDNLPPPRENSGYEKSILGAALEGDKLLLLGLLFLLYKDGGDPVLMLALLYLLM